MNAHAQNPSAEGGEPGNPSNQDSQHTPVVVAHHGHAVTTSQAVAEFFGKEHKNVLRAIENLIAELPEDFYKLNFEPIQIDADLGLGRTRKDPAYEMTRDGFTLLAMRFTGKKALGFQMAYIDAFNKMDAELTRQTQAAAALPPPKRKDREPREAAYYDIDAQPMMDFLLDWPKRAEERRKGYAQARPEEALGTGAGRQPGGPEGPEAEDETELNRRAWAVTQNHFPIIREMLADGAEPPAEFSREPGGPGSEIRLLLTLRNLHVCKVDLIGENKHILTVTEFMELARSMGLVVMAKDELVRRLLGKEV